MKKILFLLLTVLALGCDAPNRSSERGGGSEIEDRTPVDPAEPESDTASIHSDTTTSGGMNRQNQYDTLQ